jgi:acyl carrier protein
VRGVRVEPEEIEAALLAHPHVREAAVVAREDRVAREPRVTAHVVVEQEQLPTAEELRRFLRERLPEAMLPAAFTFHEAIPRQRGGGVDRAAVTRLAEPRAASAPAYVAPRNATEERLAGVWAETFAVERVGIHDSFFRLGGHSLLATQVVARVSDLFEIELPLARLFESPTVAELAKVVEQLVQSGMKVKAPPIQCVAREAVRLPADGGQTR